MELFSGLIGVALYYALLQLLNAEGFSWRGVQQHVRFALQSWKQRISTYISRKKTTGFTLIEMSIVLVIIGLIVGGILTGQGLISQAGVRAQITQIEKFNQATNAFFGKYGYLPGDIPSGPAAQFGFAPRGQYAGQGDGNGLLQGNWNNCSGCNNGDYETAGETVMFWVDLATAHLIDGGFSTASSTTPPASLPSGPAIDSWLPQAKIGGGNYVYAWSSSSFSGTIGINYFGISAVTVLPNYDGASWPGLTVAQAYSIDKKIDDGLPQSGNVLAYYIWSDSAHGNNSQPYWSNPMWSPPPLFWGGAVAPSSATCYDNANSAGATEQFSLTQNNGSGVNCALSFKMQAGD